MRAVAVVPQAPLLAPGLTGPGGESVHRVRAVVMSAVRELGEALNRPDAGPVVAVGGGARTRRHGPHAWGSLGGFGVDLRAPARRPGEPATPAALPPSLTIGCLLLQLSGLPRPLIQQEIAVGAPTRQCLAVGRNLAADAGADAVWLVLGDASARRAPGSPGHYDPRAAGFDASAALALAGADAAGLAGLDPELAAELLASGRAAWQVLAGAVATLPAPASARLLLDGAPFGVGYLVACWQW